MPKLLQILGRELDQVSLLLPSSIPKALAVSIIIIRYFMTSTIKTQKRLNLKARLD